MFKAERRKKILRKRERESTRRPLFPRSQGGGENRRLFCWDGHLFKRSVQAPAFRSQCFRPRHPATSARPYRSSQNDFLTAVFAYQLSRGSRGLLCWCGTVAHKLLAIIATVTGLSASSTLPLIRNVEMLFINLHRRFLIKVLRSALASPGATNLRTRDDADTLQHFKHVDLVALSVEDHEILRLGVVVVIFHFFI